MGLLDMAVMRGKKPARPLFMLLHGVPKIGKSTFASGARRPLFADAEEGTHGIDCARVDIRSFRMLTDLIGELLNQNHDYGTLVLDTLDAIERHLFKQVCDQANVSAIEDVAGGYGKGYTRAAEHMHNLMLSLLRLRRERGMSIVMIAHSEVVRFTDPDGADYSRWDMRLNKKTMAIVKGHAEEILFATHQVTTKKGKAVKAGGESKDAPRVLHTEWRPAREAGNRRGLPPVLPLSWPVFSDALRAATAGTVSAPKPEPRAPDRVPMLDTERLAKADAEADAAPGVFGDPSPYTPNEEPSEIEAALGDTLPVFEQKAEEPKPEVLPEEPAPTKRKRRTLVEQAFDLGHAIAVDHNGRVACSCGLLTNPTGKREQRAAANNHARAVLDQAKTKTPIVKPKAEEPKPVEDTGPPAVQVYNDIISLQPEMREDDLRESIKKLDEIENSGTTEDLRELLSWMLAKKRSYAEEPKPAEEPAAPRSSFLSGLGADDF